MACDNQTLLNLAASGGFAGLSDFDLKVATLYALCANPGAGTPASTLVAGGYAEGYAGMSARQLDECILAVVCSGA